MGLPKVKAWGMLCLAAAVLGVSYYSALSSFNAEGDTDITELTFATIDSERDHADIILTVTAVEPSKNSMTLRFDVIPKGPLSEDGGYTPSHDIKLLTNSLTGGALRLMPKGKPVAAGEITVELEDGDFGNYPVDHYQSSIVLELIKAGVDKAQNTEDAIGEVEIPATIYFNSIVHGFKLEPKKDPRVPKGEVEFIVAIERSKSSRSIAFGIMGIMALLTLLVTTIAMTVILQGRKIEFSMFGWLGGLLFAFPAIRNAFPGSPPMGCFADFIVFFWAEGIIALILITLGALWSFRPEKK